jgi:hypothetical protein
MLQLLGALEMNIHNTVNLQAGGPGSGRHYIFNVTTNKPIKDAITRQTMMFPNKEHAEHFMNSMLQNNRVDRARGRKIPHRKLEVREL